MLKPTDGMWKYKTTQNYFLWMDINLRDKMATGWHEYECGGIEIVQVSEKTVNGVWALDSLVVCTNKTKEVTKSKTTSISSVFSWEITFQNLKQCKIPSN